MQYTTIYDLAAQPPLIWRSLVLPLGLALAATVCAYYTRPGFGRYGLLAFAVIALLVSVVMPYWDYYQISQKKSNTVEGTVSGYWAKEWTKRRDGKKLRYHYEGFQVNTVSFGYFRNVQMAGFTNNAPVQYPLHDGLAVRIHYVPERQIDDGSVLNRILKFEVIQH